MSHIKPGSYTQGTLPPLSPGAQRIVERVRHAAELRVARPAGIATKQRAQQALAEGRNLDALGIMLGAKGYESR